MFEVQKTEEFHEWLSSLADQKGPSKDCFPHWAPWPRQSWWC